MQTHEGTQALGVCAGPGRTCPVTFALLPRVEPEVGKLSQRRSKQGKPTASQQASKASQTMGHTHTPTHTPTQCNERQTSSKPRRSNTRTLNLACPLLQFMKGVALLRIANTAQKEIGVRLPRLKPSPSELEEDEGVCEVEPEATRVAHLRGPQTSGPKRGT